MKEFDTLVKTINALHGPKGCPWDKAQEVDDYKRYLLEEAYELVEGIQHKNPKTVKEELGDLFLILVTITYHYNKKKKFNLKRVLSDINKKLVTRHPHVFAKKDMADKDEVLQLWIKSKAKKKKRKTIKDRIPQTAPALIMAELFLKECGYLKGDKKSKRGEVERHIAQLGKKLQEFKRKRAKEDILAEILLDICKLSFFYKVEPEVLLRHKVLDEAIKVPYNYRRSA